jgi:hypothetical protein
MARKDWNKFEVLVANASNNILYKMRDRIDDEIRLSEIAIKEGLEKRKLKKVM